MADKSKQAYDSTLEYRRVFMNERFVLPANGTRTIRHGLGYVPYFRAWSELFVGEVSFFYVDSAQYTFGFAYFDAGIFGFSIVADDQNIYIESYSPARNFYLRVYEG